MQSLKNTRKQGGIWNSSGYLNYFWPTFKISLPKTDTMTGQKKVDTNVDSCKINSFGVVEKERFLQGKTNYKNIISKKQKTKKQ